MPTTSVRSPRHRDGSLFRNYSQQQMAELFSTSKPNISMHIANILKERELNEISVVKEFLTTAADGLLTITSRLNSIWNTKTQSLLFLAMEKFFVPLCLCVQ